MLSSDAVKVAPGMPVRIEQWGGERPLEAVVRRVEPSGFTKISALGVEEQRVFVRMDFVDPYDAWEALGDAYRVEVEVITWSAQDVLRVPTGALFERGGESRVFVVENGEAWERRVEVGHRAGLEAEVLGGLEEGETVVVYPSDEVADGVRVERREV